MSNSVQLHRRQPTRLPRPWDSPGKNTGVAVLFSKSLIMDRPPQIQCETNLRTCLLHSSVQSLSRVQLCDPMNRSTPGLPVHRQLLEFTQTHVHRVCDAIQSSHPLSSLLLLTPIPPRIRVFSNKSTLHIRWPKYWSFRFSISPSKKNHPGLISFRMDWLDLCSPSDSQESSLETLNTTVQKR